MMRISFFLLAAMGVSFITGTLVLWGFSRLFRAQKATLVRAALVYGLMGVSSLLLSALSLTLLGLSPDSPSAAWGLWAAAAVMASAVGQLVFCVWCLRRVLATSVGRAVLILVCTYVGAGLVSLGEALLFRRTWAEAFVIPTGTMAPTLYGVHGFKTCSACGFRYAVNLSHRQWQRALDEHVSATCTNCGETTAVADQDPAHSGDRILVDKTSQPKRWDLIVFPYPEDPSTKYVKRLVGLPGETLEIRDGDVFVQGQRLCKPPGEIEDLWLPVHDTRFAPQSPAPNVPRWASRSDASRWKSEPDHGWRFSGGQGERDELTFPQPILDTLAYNVQFSPESMETPGRPVRDLKLTCEMGDLQGPGLLGLSGGFRGNRVRATLSATGKVQLTSYGRDGESPGAAPEKQIQAAATLPLAGRRFSLALRDGQAYVMQDGQVLAAISIEPIAGLTPTEIDAEQQRLVVSAENCQVLLPRILLERDVHYLAPAELGFSGEPLSANPIVLGDDEYYVLGDNSRTSKDSRFWGTVPVQSLTGVVRCIYWPFQRCRTFE